MNLRCMVAGVLLAAAGTVAAADDPVLEQVDALVTQAFYSPDVLRERGWSKRAEHADRRLRRAKNTASRATVFRELWLRTGGPVGRPSERGSAMDGAVAFVSGVGGNSA